MCFQLESLERKKEQVDHLLSQIRIAWFFTRSDGVKLIASQSVAVSEHWIGSSTWQGNRWIEDEDDDLPGKLRYYVAGLDFTPEMVTGERTSKQLGRWVDDPNLVEQIQKRAGYNFLRVPDWMQRRTQRRFQMLLRGCLSVKQLEELGVSNSAPASEVIRLWMEQLNY